MRTIDPALQARLDSGATTLCRCWRLTRADGLTLGFTDHDLDLSFDGAVFRAASGMSAAALQRTSGLSVDNTQVTGALQSSGISEADIAAGLYDGARLQHWLVDWTRPDLRVQLFSGTLGEITRGSGAFEAELRGLAEDLNRSIGRAFLRTCDAILGDGRCKVDISAPTLRGEVTVLGVTSNRRLRVGGLEAFPPGWFERGRLEWSTGENIGAVGQVKLDLSRTDGRALDLWEEAAREIRIGDRARVIAGCNKSAETCRTKFNNFNNFRGYPHMPGEDWITSYAATGEAHDGGSLFR